MLIELKNVDICQDEKVILRDVNFYVNHNDFIYVIGKVGSGKSSLLKSLYGELCIETGDAHILDFDLKKLKIKHIPLLRRQLGIVFQDFQLLHDKTVQQNLDFVLKATKWKKSDRKKRIEEVLNQVGLFDKLKMYPHELSGGEQQRICIARALLNNPKVILADEPVGSLDVETGRTIMNILSTAREHGTAIIMVTHNLQLLADYPGIVYRCEDGKVNEITETFFK